MNKTYSLTGIQDRTRVCVFVDIHKSNILLKKCEMWKCACGVEFYNSSFYCKK